jgi:16S rRNA (guanine527-N7)-methyltransferase
VAKTIPVPPVDAATLALRDELHVSRESWARIEAFVALLFQWQARINLVAPSTLPEIWWRHVADSFQLIKHLPQNVTRLADLGSGSGFPGLPLALLGPFDVTLFESNGKKAAFLAEALRSCGGRGRVVMKRLEDVTDAEAKGFDVVTARALAPLPLLLDWSYPFLRQGAQALFHKGQDVESELTSTTKSWRIKADRLPSSTDSEAVLLFIHEVSRV